MKEHKTFNSYDKILVRDEEGKWQIDFYSHWLEELERHASLAYGENILILDDDILPYEGNEELVGTTDEPEEEVKLEKGYIFVCDRITSLVEEWSLRNFDGCRNGFIQAFNNVKAALFGWKYAIRFSDFNPNDMEETKKHILYVKNGKVVKYKD